MSPQHLTFGVLQTVSWIPMDAVAEIIRDTVLSQEEMPTLVNAVHPRPVAWKQVMSDINACLHDKPLAVVPYSWWLEALERAADGATQEDLERIVSLRRRSYMVCWLTGN